MKKLYLVLILALFIVHQVAAQVVDTTAIVGDWLPAKQERTLQYMRVWSNMDFEIAHTTTTNEQISSGKIHWADSTIYLAYTVGDTTQVHYTQIFKLKICNNDSIVLEKIAFEMTIICSENKDIPSIPTRTKPPVMRFAGNGNLYTLYKKPFCRVYPIPLKKSDIVGKWYLVANGMYRDSILNIYTDTLRTTIKHQYSAVAEYIFYDDNTVSYEWYHRVNPRISMTKWRLRPDINIINMEKNELLLPTYDVKLKKWIDYRDFGTFVIVNYTQKEMVLCDYPLSSLYLNCKDKDHKK